jgi:methionine-rich copper-binding protein CopC
MRISERLMKANLVFAIAAVFIAGSLAPAQAHTVLIESTPAVDSTIGALPAEVSLTFADSLLVIGSQAMNQIRVVDPMGMQIAGTSVVKGAVLSVPIHDLMTSYGAYTVAYRVVAPDGHVVTGLFVFNYTQAARAAAASGGSAAATNSKAPVKLTVAADKALAGSKSNGSATGNFALDRLKNQVCYQVSIKGLTGITQAHLEANLPTGVKTSARDELFIPFTAKSISNGTYTCVKVKAKWLDYIAADPNHYDFMIHTKQYPDGAVAGLLQDALPA